MSFWEYVHTVRHLRPIQIYGRLWFHVYRPHLDLHSAPGLRVHAETWTAWAWRPPLMLDGETFRLLGTTGSVRSASDWEAPDREKLWRYNLHYFDDLAARDSSARAGWHRALITRWIQENPPGQGTGWEPYPTSLRIVNWIKGVLAGHTRGSVILERPVLDSLAAQARWLQKRLEVHLLGNHLWANAKALAFAGSFFNGSEAAQWLHKGSSLLERELKEQVLPDGGHFERSPMYHAILLEDVLDLLNLAAVYPGCLSDDLQIRLHDTATRMLRWLCVMTHPDGKIAFFNDSAFGSCADYAALVDYARRLGARIDEHSFASVEALEDSGYVRLQRDRAVVICDVAPVGPDHLPAHAHADTLSFEWSLDGERVLVNSGTSTYEPGENRLTQRGTAAHNTVVVDHENSSEVWGSFRMARRARPHGVAWGEGNGASWLEGSHDGYRRLPGRVKHRRRWSLRSGELSIEDHLEGRFRSGEAHLHLHPAVSALVESESAVALQTAGAKAPTIRLSCSPPSPISRRRAQWHHHFGQSLGNTTLSIPFRSGSLITRLRWQ